MENEKSSRKSSHNLPRNFPYHHHKEKEEKKKIRQKKREDEGKNVKKSSIIRKFSSSFPSASAQHISPPQHFERMSKAGFLLTPTQATHL
jgi:hypothetical protein